MQLDEVPAVASTSGGFDFDAAPAEETFDHLSFDELLRHPNWKARKVAYEHIASNDADADREAFLQLVDSLGSKDATSPALDSFLEAIAVVISNDEGSLSVIANPSLVTLAVEKGLTGRPRAASAAARILAGCIGCGEGEPVSTALFANISAKAPKVRLAVIQNLAQSVQEFGVQWLNVKQLLTSLKPLFNDTDAKVRKETQNLCVVCYRFIGDAVMRYLSDLREVQLQELTKLFAQVKCDAVAARRVGPATIRPSQQQQQQPASGRSSSQQMTASMASFDPYNDQPTQPVLPRLPQDFFELTRDRNAKWSERVDYINDHLLKALSVPRITPDADYTELVKTIRDFINDMQLPISVAGFKCLQALARGLRHGMAPYVRFVIPCLFDKFKEKKAAALEATSTSLAMLIQYGCCSYDHFQDELEASVNSKLPNHRHAALQWALQVFSADPEPGANLGRMSRASGMIRKALADEKVEVREAGMALLAKIMESCGPSSMRDVINLLDDKQRARLGLGGPVNSTVGPMNPAALSQSRATAVPSTRSAAPRPGAPAALAPAATNFAGNTVPRKAVVAARPGGSAPSSQASTPTASSATTYGIEDASLTGPILVPEAAKTLLESIFPPELHEAIVGLGATAWRTRADSAAALEAFLRDAPPELATDAAPALTAWLKAVTGGKETLFQAVNASATMCAALAARAQHVPTRAALTIFTQFTSKLTEPKSRLIVRDLLSTLTEHVGPKFSLRVVCGITEEVANPKLYVEALDWIDLVLQEFPQAPVDAKSFVDFIRSRVLEQPTPAVRAAGIKSLSVLRVRVGVKLDALVNGINPHLKQSYEEAIANFTVSPVTVRSLRAGALDAAPARAAAGKPQALQQQQQAMGDLPPSDISHVLTAAAQTMVSGKDWRDRANAVKCVEEAVNAAGKNITGNGVSEALKALRTRLDEPNKNFVLDVLRVINLLMESSPQSSIRAGAKVVFPATINMLGDMKQQLRDEAIRACNLSLMSVGLEPLLTPFVKALATENQSARLALSELLVASMNANHHTAFAPKAMVPLVQPLLRMLVDRYIEIRQRAEVTMSYVLSNVGLETVHRAMSAFKPMDQKLMAPIIDRIRPIDAMPAMPPRLQTMAPIPVPPVVEANRNASWQQQAPVAATPARKQFTVSEITAGLKNARDGAVPQLCADLQAHVQVDVMSIDARTLDALLTRARALYLTGNGPQTEESYAATRAVFCVIADLMLDVAFAGHLVGEDVAAIANTCFACIQCPAAAEPHSQDILRTINGIMARLLQNGHPSVLVTVLVNMLLEHCERDNVEGSPYIKKCIDLTVKCIYKMTNFDHRFSPENVIPLSANFLHRLPPSSFQARDDSPIRAIKHVLKHLLTQHPIDEMLCLCERLVGQSSLVYSFVHLWQLRLAQEAEQRQAVASHARAQAEATRHHDPNEDGHTAAPTRHTTVLPRNTVVAQAHRYAEAPQQVDPAEVIAMFSRARTHETSAQGLRELYLYQCQNPKCRIYAEQYQRCSDAFKRHMDTIFLRFREGSA